MCLPKTTERGWENRKICDICIDIKTSVYISVSHLYIRNFCTHLNKWSSSRVEAYRRRVASWNDFPLLPLSWIVENKLHTHSSLYSLIVYSVRVTLYFKTLDTFVWRCIHNLTWNSSSYNSSIVHTHSHIKYKIFWDKSDVTAGFHSKSVQ